LPRERSNYITLKGLVDAPSYLKTPRVFGFHGVYKRLAVHLGLVNVHLRPGPNTERVVDAWARGQRLGGLAGAKSHLAGWSTAVRLSLAHEPPRTRPHWNQADWAALAGAFAPAAATRGEKRRLRDLLLSPDDALAGALTVLWQLQAAYRDDEFEEESLHRDLEKREPVYAPLIHAIRSYEAFARGLADGFDVLRAEAAGLDARGYAVPDIGRHEGFAASVAGLDERFAAAHRALGDVSLASGTLRNLFDERFAVFAEPMDPGGTALALCDHHEAIQRAKSADGKRAWFDRMGPERIYIRHAYRVDRRPIEPGRYVHDYRGRPIRRFRADLM